MDLAGLTGIDPGPPHAFSYVSVPTVSFSDRDLRDLLIAARRVNAHYGVTGKLLALEDPTSGELVRFFQWVEGTGGAVDAVVARIGADDRHRIVDVLWHGPIPWRRFRGWDMAFSTTIDQRVYEEAVVEAQS